MFSCLYNLTKYTVPNGGKSDVMMDLLAQRLHLSVIEGASHVTVDKARRNGIDRDIARCHFSSQRLRKADHPGFRGRVIGLSGVPR